MNPALQNYLQNQQQQAAPQQQSQPYNPFDAGIQKAIASARQSLGMNANQEEDAFNKGLLAFGDAIAGSPREKGFLNNLASAGRALSPGIRAYDEAETNSLAQNQALANEILKQDAAERDRQEKAEQTAWDRQHSINQLAEQRRYHDLMYGSMGARSGEGKTEKEKRTESASGELSNILNNAEKLLTNDLEKQETYRGRASNFLSRFTPGGYIPTKKQAEVNALGDVLRGKLFNTWKYRNRAEFEHVPSISADNPPEVNLEIIKTLKNLLANAEAEEQGISQGAPSAKESSMQDEIDASDPFNGDEEIITVVDPNNPKNSREIPLSYLSKAEQLGWKRQ